MAILPGFLKKRVKEPEHERERRDDDHFERSQHGSDHDESNWLVSYADMMTLLCGFFIMLFSMSKLDEPQYEKVKESVATHFGGEYKSPTQEIAKHVTQIINEAGLEKDAAIRVDTLGVAITFTSTLFFDTLSAEIRPEGQVALQKLIHGIAAFEYRDHKRFKIVVEGHTDSRPVIGGAYASNWELSGARAARVIRMFLDRGFEPTRLTAIGYADTYPEGPSRRPAGEWDDAVLSKSRRVVLRILDPRVEAIPYPALPDAPTAASAPITASPGRVPAGVPSVTPSSSPLPVLPSPVPTRP